MDCVAVCYKRISQRGTKVCVKKARFRGLSKKCIFEGLLTTPKYALWSYYFCSQVAAVTTPVKICNGWYLYSGNLCFALFILFFISTFFYLFMIKQPYFSLISFPFFFFFLSTKCTVNDTNFLPPCPFTPKKWTDYVALLW